jgi:hypothetical protein
LAKGEKPAVWFSSNEQWEPTANMPLRRADGTTTASTKDATHLLGGGLARIGVVPEAAPHDWEAYKRLSGVTAKRAREIYKAGVAQGARPAEWFASFEPVPRSKWLGIEVWDGQKWGPYQFSAASASPRP